MKKAAISALLLILAVFATGTLITLAMPLGEKGSLILVALVPLLFATKQKGAIAGFLGGLGAIFWFAFLTTAGWLYEVKHLEPSSGWNYTACGLYAFVFAIFFVHLGRRQELETPYLVARRPRSRPRVSPPHPDSSASWTRPLSRPCLYDVIELGRDLARELSGMVHKTY